MRKREQLRIDKARRERKNAVQRLSRALKKGGQARADKEKIAETRDQITRLTAKLDRAILAPTKARLKDVKRRPHRYTGKTITKIRNLDQKRQRKIKNRPGLNIDLREAKANKLLKQALDSGKQLEKIYRKIAKLTGLPEHRVFTLGMYL